MHGPDPDAVRPNPAIPQLCFLKRGITRPNIVVGDYTYYDDPGGAEAFERRVTHHYEFLGDKLVVGKFCAIARGVEFVMNGANHRMNSVTTYPFNLFGGGWEKSAPAPADLPFKGDTVVGNDVWIGQDAAILPGVEIGDGAIVAARAVVARDVPPYHIVGGNPARVLRARFAPDLVACLTAVRWWDWPPALITARLEDLCSGDVDRIRRYL